MTYVLKFYALYWIIALLGGVMISILTWQSRERPGWFTGWTAWATVLFLVGLVVALLKIIAGRGGHYLELALIFFAAYIIGCWLGAMLRALFAPAREDLRVVEQKTASGPALATAGAAVAGAGAATAAVPPAVTVSRTATPAAKASLASAGEAAAKPAPPSTPAASSTAGVAAGSSAVAAVAQPSGPKPSGLAGPRSGKADDLKLIRGIGRQNEERLHGLGIYHFDQIAAWSKENVEWVGDFLAFPGRIEREDWVGQASQLAAGGQTDFSRRVNSGEVPTSLTAVAADALADAHPGTKPAGITAARNDKPDDLKKISGIGRQNEERLHSLGVYHFDQIAAWTKDNVEWVGSFMSFPGRIEREKWVEQAGELAAGRETEFSKRVASGDVPTSQDDK